MSFALYTLYSILSTLGMQWFRQGVDMAYDACRASPVAHVNSTGNNQVATLTPTQWLLNLE